MLRGIAPRLDPHYRRHGDRMSRDRSFDASASPMISSRTGSHRSLRPVNMAIWPSHPGVAERKATSAGAMVWPRVLTHSMNWA